MDGKAGLLLGWVLGACLASSALASDPFLSFDLPDDWETRFWASPDAQGLLKLEPQALTALVPTQAGLRHCRCPNCDASEADNTLTWSPAKPDLLTCKRCAATFPNEKVPAKADGKVPEETVEVRPRKNHHYPYHVVEADRQLYPEERLYLAAKRDYEAREYLAKAALYAAIRHKKQPANQKDPRLARLAALVILRFAQVYADYAGHTDQPGESKFLGPAEPPATLPRGFRTAKWDWSGAQEVPLNLAIAYALIRQSPALAEAGQALGEPNPSAAIERQLFRASADLLRRQPEDFGESGLLACRGLLAAGRLLDDPALMHDAINRLARFSAQGFYHDGLWRGGDAATQRRVTALVDGWIDRLLAGYSDRPNAPLPDGESRLVALPGAASIPVLGLARSAGGTLWAEPGVSDVLVASWPSPSPRPAPRRGPILLGGAGIAHLSVGSGADALDLELRDLGSRGAAPPPTRLALRLAVGGRPILGDLDDHGPAPWGWEHATASHNAVLVDGLNQRESVDVARQPAPGGDILFHAATPMFQVVTLDDRHAYPRSATRCRQTLIAVAGRRARYAVSVVEVTGGLQHDQIFHASAGSDALWRPSCRMSSGQASLLPPNTPFLPNARAEDGRWFVQAYGAFEDVSSGLLDRAGQAWLESPNQPGVRLHFLGDLPATLITARSPDPLRSTGGPGRSSLIVRRRSEDGATLHSVLVTLFEPAGPGVPPLVRAGRVSSPRDLVLLAIQTADGLEHLAINLAPGAVRSATLSDGRHFRTDGLAVRVTADELTLAGGRFAEAGAATIEGIRASSKLVSAGRSDRPDARGLFRSADPLPYPDSLAGQTVLIRHGDGTTRGWTIVLAEAAPEGGTRLHVREEAGFTLDPTDGSAHCYQFPGTQHPGPHVLRVATLARRVTR